MKLKNLIVTILAFLPCGSAISNPHIIDTVIYADGNPIIKYKFTADPAAMVFKGKVYLYTGHDVAPTGVNGYDTHDWCCFSSNDMLNWTEHDMPLNVKDFAWAKVMRGHRK